MLESPGKDRGKEGELAQLDRKESNQTRGRPFYLEPGEKDKKKNKGDQKTPPKNSVARGAVETLGGRERGPTENSW